MLIDNSAQANLKVIKNIRDKHRIELKNFRLINIAQRRIIRNWSEKLVAVLRIENLDEEHTFENFNKNLDIIRKF